VKEIEKERKAQQRNREASPLTTLDAELVSYELKK
jgi:hypothetical protein